MYVRVINARLTFKPGACQLMVGAWFLDIAFVHKVSVRTCVHDPEVINNYSHEMKL